jgi:hypothetical protein
MSPHDEIRSFSGSIVGTVSDTGSIMLSSLNPFGQNVSAKNIKIEILAISTVAATMDCGIGSIASADYTNMIAALPLNPGTSYPSFYSWLMESK